MAGAALANLHRGSYEQGFSTITVQLARNLYPDRIRARPHAGAQAGRDPRGLDIEDRYQKDDPPSCT
jgi:membrane carboxypeptidase/penicillin-binding protein PbpC